VLRNGTPSASAAAPVHPACIKAISAPNPSRPRASHTGSVAIVDLHRSALKFAHAMECSPWFFEQAKKEYRLRTSDPRIQAVISEAALSLRNAVKVLEEIKNITDPPIRGAQHSATT
jgi:hypothetical protein